MTMNNDNQFNENLDQPIRFTGRECYGERIRKLKLCRLQYERQKAMQPKFINKMEIK